MYTRDLAFYVGKPFSKIHEYCWSCRNCINNYNKNEYIDSINRNIKNIIKKYKKKALKSVDKYEPVCYYKLNKKQNTLSNINTTFSMKETRNLHKKNGKGTDKKIESERC